VVQEVVVVQQPEGLVAAVIQQGPVEVMVKQILAVAVAVALI